MRSMDGQLIRCEHLPEPDICHHVRTILIEVSNIQPVSNPVTICGDIHGQSWVLLKLLRKGGSVPETSYIFMARDFVDRGRDSIETVFLLFALQSAALLPCVFLCYPTHRGGECQQKYGSARCGKHVVIYCLRSPHFAAIIDGEVLCIPHEGAFCDFMCPTQMTSRTEVLAHAAQGDSSAEALRESETCVQFNHVNSISLIARAHQLVQGYKYMFDEALATLRFSVRENGARSFTVYGPAEEDGRDVAQQRTRRAPYVGALFSAHGTVLLGGVGHANCFITSPLFEPWSRLERVSNAVAITEWRDCESNLGVSFVQIPLGPATYPRAVEFWYSKIVHRCRFPSSLVRFAKGPIKFPSLEQRPSRDSPPLPLPGPWWHSGGNEVAAMSCRRSKVGTHAQCVGSVEVVETGLTVKGLAKKPSFLVSGLAGVSCNAIGSTPHCTMEITAGMARIFAIPQEENLELQYRWQSCLLNPLPWYIDPANGISPFSNIQVSTGFGKMNSRSHRTDSDPSQQISSSEIRMVEEFTIC
ncbi:Metallo-dependent phosphatase-like protein [Russula dissimulans]|nr:Metallo-dependent phosphatase-like protein [Russula dissimulans]